MGLVPRSESSCYWRRMLGQQRSLRKEVRWRQCRIIVSYRCRDNFDLSYHLSIGNSIWHIVTALPGLTVPAGPVSDFFWTGVGPCMECFEKFLKWRIWIPGTGLSFSIVCSIILSTYSSPPTTLLVHSRPVKCLNMQSSWPGQACDIQQHWWSVHVSAYA